MYTYIHHDIPIATTYDSSFSTPNCKKGVSLCLSTTISSLVDASSTFTFATNCYSQLGTVRVELILAVSGAII